MTMAFQLIKVIGDKNDVPVLAVVRELTYDDDGLLLSVGPEITKPVTGCP